LVFAYHGPGLFFSIAHLFFKKREKFVTNVFHNPVIILSYIISNNIKNNSISIKGLSKLNNTTNLLDVGNESQRGNWCAVKRI